MVRRLPGVGHVKGGAGTQLLLDSIRCSGRLPGAKQDGQLSTANRPAERGNSLAPVSERLRRHTLPMPQDSLRNKVKDVFVFIFELRPME